MNEFILSNYNLKKFMKYICLKNKKNDIKNKLIFNKTNKSSKSNFNEVFLSDLRKNNITENIDNIDLFLRTNKNFRTINLKLNKLNEFRYKTKKKNFHSVDLKNKFNLVKEFFKIPIKNKIQQKNFNDFYTLNIKENILNSIEKNKVEKVSSNNNLKKKNLNKIINISNIKTKLYYKKSYNSNKNKNIKKVIILDKKTNKKNLKNQINSLSTRIFNNKKWIFNDTKNYVKKTINIKYKYNSINKSRKIKFNKKSKIIKSKFNDQKENENIKSYWYCKIEELLNIKDLYKDTYEIGYYENLNIKNYYFNNSLKMVNFILQKLKRDLDNFIHIKL